MRYSIVYPSALLGLAASAQSQQAPWGQCGGNGWTGPKTCASGSYCVSQNEWYSQCIPGDSPVTTTTKASTLSTTMRPASTTTRPAVTTSRAVATTTRVAATTTRVDSAATYTANPQIGPGGSTFVDSPHFRVYGASGAAATSALNTLEAAYSCFVGSLGWRSSGLSYFDSANDGPWTKVNMYVNDNLPGAAGVMHATSGISWLEVRSAYTTVPGVSVHEYGHGLTYAAQNWVDQGRTGAWWETVANWVADTYKNSPICAEARTKYSQPTTGTDIDLNKVIGDSFQVLVDGSVGTGNYYQAWPFLSYMTYNPDNFAGLGRDTVRESFARYNKGTNETPLHVFARLSTGATIQRVVGRYWARMAYVDIGHPSAQQVFLSQRSRINYANLDSQGNGVYKVKSARRPRYMGANLIPLTKSGAVTFTASISSSGSYTATLAIRNTSSGATRYVDFNAGSVSASIAASEEATVVIANTPALVLYDPFTLTAELNTGLDYTLTLTGASA